MTLCLVLVRVSHAVDRLCAVVLAVLVVVRHEMLPRTRLVSIVRLTTKNLVLVRVFACCDILCSKIVLQMILDSTNERRTNDGSRTAGCSTRTVDAVS